MQDTANRSPAQPSVVLGLTFLLIGLSFALPFQLVPQAEVNATNQHFSPEVANVYACVAWAGWAHFLFAFRGQGTALSRIGDGSKILRYGAAVVLAIAALVGARWAVGPALFGAVVWVYFIDHFMKAEQTFEGRRSSASMVKRWLSSSQVLITFAWLTVVLLNVSNIDGHPWELWGCSLLLGAAVLLLGGWKKLASGEARGPLLSLFFVAEALVWGTFSRYGGERFLTGVYVFHIAAGSYFHYLGSYFFAGSRTRGRDIFSSPIFILLVNLAVIGLGFAVARQESLRWLTPIVGIQWFTLWVAVHLVSSDVFPWIKSMRFRGQAAGRAIAS